MKSQPLLYYAEQVGAGSGQLISSLIHQILGSKKKNDYNRVNVLVKNECPRKDKQP